MYKIIGSDGKEYGPVNLDQMRKWIAEGRINGQTRVQAAGATGFKAATEFPELGLAAATAPAPGGAPPALPAGGGEGGNTSLAITSLVLGALSLVCFGFLTGIPAIICGHLARGRVRQNPREYGGSGYALAGLIMGYVGVAVTLLIMPALLLPALSQAKGKAQKINCVNNLKQVGLAVRIWAMDNNDQFPFNASTNKGGTLELCKRGSDGFDLNPALHLQVMSNELSTPKILWCPADTRRQPATTFASLGPANVSYQLCTGTNVCEVNPQEVLAICPIHNNVLMCDGSVQTLKKMPAGGK